LLNWTRLFLNSNSGRKHFFQALLLLVTLPAFGQLHLMPIQKSIPVSSNGRFMGIQVDTMPINLPFWEDFSGSTGSPDSARWINSGNVLVNSTLGIGPPSLNVATLDGFDAFGQPYDVRAEAPGFTDSLVSRFIDLTQVPAFKRNTVFISFFWQIEGRGELPDSEDFFRLQFKDNEGQWIDKFIMSGGDMTLSDIFQQEIIAIDSARYYHPEFQFRFQSFGNLQGSFDSWNIDYILLTANRSDNDFFHFDRAITAQPSPVFEPYTSIPLRHFVSDPESYLTTPSTRIVNLDALIERQPISFSSFLFNQETGDLIDQMDAFNNLTFTLQGGPTNESLNGQERRIIISSPIDANALTTTVENILNNQDADTAALHLQTKFILHSGDGNLIDSIFTNSENQMDTVFFEDVDLKANDTVYNKTVLKDFYAYDDGTAEFAVGVNQNGGQIAYRYILEQPDILTHIDINFPRIATSTTPTIRVFVRKKLSDSPEDILHMDSTFSIPEQTGNNNLNSFNTYPLPNLAVGDTIFIGYEQVSDNRLGIGFDKNTSSFENVFFNVSGAWEQDNTLEGSLMMRPRFEKRIVTGINDEKKITAPDPPEENLVIFPNPSNGVFLLKGAFDKIEVYDILGQRMILLIDGERIDLSDKPDGIYIAHIYYKGTITIQKLILNR